MALIVTKFGGSSVSDVDALRKVARRVVDIKKRGDDVVVVVSAMGDMTDDLLDLAGRVTKTVPPVSRELDILLSAGERISMSLLAMAIRDLGVPASSYTGPQAGLITDMKFGEARIVGVEPDRLVKTLHEGGIPVVAGFQGFHKDSFNTTTLGRGGSDTTAVALAHALGAQVCEIYTDVDGIFTADPRMVPSARQLETVTDEEMLELAAHGANILHLRAVEFARRHGVEIRVRSSFSEGVGTLITNASKGDQTVEEPVISGVSVDRTPAKVTVVGVPDVPGAAARIFQTVAGADVHVDMVVQNVSLKGNEKTDISFTVPVDNLDRVRKALAHLSEDMDFEDVIYNDQIGKLSVVGAGIRSHTGAYATVFEALSKAHINIQMISASEVRISVIMDAHLLETAAQVIHSVFGLDDPRLRAKVYAGTGR